MKLIKSCIFALMILIGASSAAFADRIRLVQGRRAVADKISFTVEVAREKNRDPKYPPAPYDIQIYAVFADHSTSGFVYVDGKAIGRFDDARQFNSNPADTTYGRHVITLVVSNPSVLGDFYVTVRDGVVREVLEGDEAVGFVPNALEKRVVDLERKVQDLEVEIATLKKKRAH
jgi:hypothetical protein